MSRIHPVQVLVDEHAVIEQVLGVMASTLQQMGSDPAAPSRLEKILDFLEHFVEGCHHQREERGLFPLLRRKGLGGTARRLLDEHQSGHQRLAALRGALPLAVQGNLQALDFLRAEGLTYIALLREHLQQEEETLFEVVRQVLTEQEIEEIDAALGAAGSQFLGDEAYERYLEMAEELTAAPARP